MTYDQQIAAVVAEIAPILKAGFDPETYAAGLLEEADDLGVNGVNQVRFEVRGLHTKSGAPYTFSIKG